MTAPDDSDEKDAGGSPTGRVAGVPGKHGGPVSGLACEAASREVAALAQQIQGLTAAVKALERRLPSPLVTVHQAAAHLGCSSATIRRKVKSGAIPHTRVGRAVRIDLSKLRVMSAEEIQELARRALSR